MINFSLWEHDEDTLVDIVNLLNYVYPNNPINYENFKYKHLNNPEGISIIACAYDKKKLVGARAFWFFYDGEQRYIQPCDTVTHPDYQRKGIFNSLTKMCLEKSLNYVKFNFPNKNSYPGYIKLGWFRQKTSNWLLNFNLYHEHHVYVDVNTLKDMLYFRAELRWAEFVSWRFLNWPSNNYKFYLVENGFFVVNNKRFCAFIAFNKFNLSRPAMPSFTFSFIPSINKKNGIYIPSFLISPPYFVVLGEVFPSFLQIDLVATMDTF